jgi:molecular chaperone GrpE
MKDKKDQKNKEVEMQPEIEPTETIEETVINETENITQPDTEKIIADCNEWKDKYTRMVAEFDNYRKRNLKERIELSKTASKDIIIELLPVLDDFERAIQAAADSKDIEAVKSGIELIYNKYKNILSQQGLKEIEAENHDFTTDFHEAITNIPAPTEEQKGKVVAVVQKGYILNDNILRYAKVVVGE